MATMGGILFILYFTGTIFMRNISALTGKLLGLGYGTDAVTVMRSASLEMTWLLAPVFAAAVIFAVLSNVAQGGFLLKPLTFEASRLNPLSGWKNLFSISSLPGIFKSFVKFIIGCLLFYFVIKNIITALPQTAAMDIPDIQATAFTLTSRAVTYSFTTFFVLALADYFYERWRFERSIRMSQEEIKEEYRESEGDPIIKARIKSLQRETARRRMMEAVPKATVVITNPTHIAVALRYNREDSSAPRVVAKGKELVAERIKALARKHGVPLVEDRQLARALVNVKLDAVIPEELYRAVAKILAYIFKLRGVAQ